MRMCSDILKNIIHTLASRGVVFSPGHFISLRSAYLRMAQDAIRQYHADALINSLTFNRHGEEQAIEAFSQQITAVGDAIYENPSAGESIPTWTRVLTTLPDFPQQLRQVAIDDRREYC